MMSKLQELYILALELELGGESTVEIYEDIAILEDALEIDDL